MSDLKGSGTATPASQRLEGEAGAHQTPPPPSASRISSPWLLGEKMRSGCGMRESGGGGWDGADEGEGKCILHSFWMA